MATYTIIIQNKSGSKQPQQYLLFNAAPALGKDMPDGFSNVWIKTTGTPSPHGAQKIQITTTAFAVCGTLPNSGLAHGVEITESDQAQVSLAGSLSGTAAIMDIVEGGPGFQIPYGTTQESGSFEIDTGTWSTAQYPNAFWIGMGRYGSDGQTVVPVASYPALPNQKYIVEPVVTYYVATGSYTPGTVVHLTDVGAYATIDFTQATGGETIATITQNDSLTFDGPVFSFPIKADGTPRLPTAHKGKAEGKHHHHHNGN